MSYQQRSNSRVDLESILDMSTNVRSNVVPRWQRKAAAASTSKQVHKLNLNKGGTPHKKHSRATSSSRNGTPTAKKKRTSKKNTPTKQMINKTDRFIPNRSAMNLELCRYSLKMKNEDKVDTNASQDQSQTNELADQFKKTLAANMLGDTESQNYRVLSFRDKAPAHADDVQNTLKVRYSKNNKTTISIPKPSRYIPSAPTRILDAPELVDDYYLNLISWGNRNMLAVALGPAVYLWNAATGGIEELMSVDEDNYITSVSWIQEGGNHLAIGTSDAAVQLWDTDAIKQVRSMDGHQARVGSLDWNSNILSSGSRDSSIIHHDVRVRDHQVATLRGHEQEVCGLKWSPDGKYLASGGNDNMLCIWDATQGHSGAVNPTFVRHDHNAAVKALAWCPWERNLLASGGGTADRTIKFWNARNGAMLNSIDTGSQVCSLLWSPTEKELLSSHGYSQNQLCLWRYPTMTKIKELTGHSARVLHLAGSPDGSSVVSAAADETLRFWSIFGSATKSLKKATTVGQQTAPKSSLSAIMGIR